jgi:hypothetical protein
MQKHFHLKRGELLAVQGAGTKVDVAVGGAWITQHGDINDYFVQDASWGPKSDGLVLIHAIGDCRVAVFGKHAATATLRRRARAESPIGNTILAGA